MELKYKNHQPGLILTTKRQIFAMLNVLYKSAIRSRHHKYTDTENHYVYLLSGRKFKWKMILVSLSSVINVLSK